jgi:hypothetical protein
MEITRMVLFSDWSVDLLYRQPANEKIIHKSLSNTGNFKRVYISTEELSGGPI